MINLLPWREELRQKRKKEFLMAVLLAVVAAAALTFGTKTYYKAQISNQQDRNQMLSAEITELDKQIAEINELDAQKQRLLDRLEVIEQLERTTPETVLVVDALVDIVPEGVHLTVVTQNGTNLTVDGRNQSSQRVSEMMRNVENNAWLKNDFLDIVSNTDSGPQGLGQFRVFMDQIPIADNPEALQ
jgi:type IV pilus assembly protein PilN